MTSRTSLLLVISALVAPALSCASNEQTGPQVASAADQYGYAARYPNQLASARGALDAYENQMQTVTARFGNYSGELTDPDWELVQGVVERADQAGKSQAYVARMREVDTVGEFFDDEADEIVKKVGGAAQYAAKQKDCDGSGAYGAVKTALPKAVKKQLEERLRAHNEAHVYLAEHEETLGKQNVEKLKVQADEVAYASYVANVAVVQVKHNLAQWVEEASQVQSTLDDKIAEAQETLADAKASEAEKKSAQATLDAAQQARQQLDSEVEQARHVLEQADQRIEAVQKQYRDAYDALVDEIEKKRSEAPSPAAEGSAPAT